MIPRPALMKFTLAPLLAALGALSLVTTARADGQARADYRNLTSVQAATQQRNPGVTFFGGYLYNPKSTEQGGNATRLQQCAFGQPFSQWFPSDTFGRDVIAKVKAALYLDPGAITTRDAVLQSKIPFRYKWLLYSGSGTDVTTFAADVANWFTDADRAGIYAQIKVLKEAFAASPFDSSLRNTLLDVYNDLAVAEMQAVKPQLADLAQYHLGIKVLPTDKFIIDKEIDTYSNLTATIQLSVNQFNDLLGVPFPNIDPASFDSRISPGVPMGQYIFRAEQAHRNSTPSQFVGSSGAQEVPQVDPATGKLVTPGTLFTGYKDLNVLLQIIGQRQQYLAALARLRGTRQAPGDLALARESITTALADDENDLQEIRSWFPELFPVRSPQQTAAEYATQVAEANRYLEESGVLAALSGLESGRVDMLGVLPFLNGSANLLGYDPNFLLLVQDNSGAIPPLDSFDTLRRMLKGDNQPLTVALNRLNSTPGVSPPDGAVSLYNNFVSNAELVAADIDTADGALADRYYAITGHEPNETKPDGTPAFKPEDLNTATPGSELGGANLTITNLLAQGVINSNLTAELNFQIYTNVDGTTRAAVGLAQEKYVAITNAAQDYKNRTSPYYTEMISQSGTAAAVQAGFDAINDVGSLVTAAANANLTDGYAGAVAGGVFAGIVGGVGAANVAVQHDAASSIGKQQQNIDYAGIDLSVTTQLPDAVLAINQANQQLASLKREQLANNLTIQSTQGALLQAYAQRDSLVSELARIQARRNDTVNGIRKKAYADPLSYYRAEAALIVADESFRTAQRWMFYAVQALNYKWNGRFAITQGSKSYDSSTVFKCRNANELDDLLTQMVRWDSIRVVQTTSSPLLITRISLLEHILARNPRRSDPVDSSDPGTRLDDTVSPQPDVFPVVTTLQYFRNLLTTKYRTPGGDLVIPFGTVFRNELADRVDGNFFRGATYDQNGTCTDPGFWREKIEYVKVNVIAGNAPAVPSNLSGGLAYGGTTYFHTRVPPRSNRTVGGLLSDDSPGELMVAPFQLWVSPDFSENFVPEDHQIVSIPVAYSQSSAVIQGGGGIQDNLGGTYQVNAFAGRSIAASDWNLTLYRQQGNGFVVDVNNLQDIEIIIAYRHSDRVYPPNN